MAFSKNLTDPSNVIVAASGTSVAANTVPDNTHTVILLNLSTTATAYVVTNGTPGGALTPSTSWQMPPESALTLPIGVLGMRAGPALIIVDGSAPLTVQVGYINHVADQPGTV